MRLQRCRPLVRGSCRALSSSSTGAYSYDFKGPSPTDAAWLRTHVSMLMDSLCATGLSNAYTAEEDWWGAFHESSDVALLSAGTQADPVLNYGNKGALSLFEMNWESLTTMPGRRTAEPGLRADRQRQLDLVRDQGYIGDYTGIRVKSTGDRFRIHGATVWELRDPTSGLRTGQAAMFDIASVTAP